MIKFVSILFFKEIKKMYFKIFLLLVIFASFITCYLNYYNYESSSNDLLIVEEKLSENEFEKVYPNGEYDNYLVQYEEYIKQMESEIKLFNVREDNRLFVMDNVFSVQVFIIILSIIVGSVILTKEYSSGVLKYTLTKGYSKVQVFLSFLITTFLLSLILNIVLFISFVLFISLMCGDFSLFTLEIPLINNKVYYTNYLLTVLKKFSIYMLPILFMGLFSFLLSTILFNASFVISLGLCMSLFGLLLTEWLLGFKIKLLTYTILPYLDFSIFNNKFDVINFNMQYGINLSINSGIIILVINFVLLLFIAMFCFVKRDIK